MTELKKIVETIEDRNNNKRLKAMQDNPTFLNFMACFFMGHMKWACDKGYKFSNVGIDAKESLMTANGKTIVLKPMFTTKNDPEPKSSILLPGKDF